MDQDLKNLLTPSVHSWDTVNFRALATPIFDQTHSEKFWILIFVNFCEFLILIFVNLYQHAKNQVISFISSGDIID